ncbi:MAG TPA: alkaline phosphatase family protein [Candidatus Cybelea sp.]|nr:alkaline phosphatase family protein [Candidatus Cybelea sp.]
MNLRRLSASLTAGALAASLLSACNSSSSMLPSSAYGTKESARMSPQMHSMLVTRLHNKIKHVFVIFQENHSYDNYFGTYPNSENLGTHLAKTHGFSQYDHVARQMQTVFKITNPDVLGPDQDRYILENKFDGGKMDNFLSGEELDNIKNYGVKPGPARQYGLTTMAIYDCDTIPYLWQYAKNFVLLDHYFQSETGPSSPGNVAMFAGQAGISQEHLYPKEASNESEGPGVPINGDLDPFNGPYTGQDSTVQIPQSYATLGMTLGGASEAAQAQARPFKVLDDLKAVAGAGQASTPWMWAQEGFVNSHGAKAMPGYVAHHNAPQYFDYIRRNNVYWSQVGTTESLMNKIASGTLPDSGVFFVKGSKENHFDWKPASKNPLIQKEYLGDDDHPGAGNSDAQVAEAFVATYVNAIAQSKYWKDSAILITWDDGGGFFDHVAPNGFEQCNDGFACGDGQRVPFIVLSPYSLSGAVLTDYSDTVSVSKFVEAVFGVPAMSSLPDEASVAPYGPRDGKGTALSDLAGAFDISKLDGNAGLNPASMAEIPATTVNTFPSPMNCKSLNIRPLHIPAQPSYYHPDSLLQQAAKIESRHTRSD